MKNDQCRDLIQDHDPGHDQDRAIVIAEDVADDILLSVNTSNKILYLLFFHIACINSECIACYVESVRSKRCSVQNI